MATQPSLNGVPSVVIMLRMSELQRETLLMHGLQRSTWLSKKSQHRDSAMWQLVCSRIRHQTVQVSCMPSTKAWRKLFPVLCV